jgi:hypothetical protein
MQKGQGYLGFSGQQVARAGCVVAAWSNIINTILGREAVTPSSFGVIYEKRGVQTVAGENTKYLDAEGNLNFARLVSEKTGGEYTAFKATTNLKERLAALESLEGNAYVAGAGKLVDRDENHTVNVVPDQAGGLGFQGTSDFDKAPFTRTYSLDSGDSRATKITEISYAIPASQVKAFDAAFATELRNSAARAQAARAEAKEK